MAPIIFLFFLGLASANLRLRSYTEERSSWETQSQSHSHQSTNYNFIESVALRAGTKAVHFDRVRHNFYQVHVPKYANNLEIALKTRNIDGRRTRLEYNPFNILQESSMTPRNDATGRSIFYMIRFNEYALRNMQQPVDVIVDLRGLRYGQERLVLRLIFTGASDISGSSYGTFTPHYTPYSDDGNSRGPQVYYSSAQSKFLSSILAAAFVIALI